MSPDRGLDLVLVGFGTVARRFVDLLGRLPAATTLGCRVVAVATARQGCAVAPGGVPARTLAALAEGTATVASCHGAPEPRPATTQALLDRAAAASASSGRAWVVVENTPLGLDGGQPGLDHVRRALDLGADVITANKGPIAFAYRELRQRAARGGRVLRFEGTVLDGLPVFSLLRDTLPGVRVTRVRGIVNTTTNHLLTAMEHGQTLDHAIAQMQAAGIAEADPALDVDGWDAAAKAAVLANVLFEAALTPHDVRRVGLRTTDPAEVRAAATAGDAIKLVVTVDRQPDGVVATVAPQRLDRTDPLGGLSGTAKGLVIETNLLGPITISKPTSEATHTAYALVADLLSIHRLRRRP